MKKQGTDDYLLTFFCGKKEADRVSKVERFSPYKRKRYSQTEQTQIKKAFRRQHGCCNCLNEWVYMSTENSVNRSLKTRSLLTKFGTCNITATGAVTI